MIIFESRLDKEGEQEVIRSGNFGEAERGLRYLLKRALERGQPVKRAGVYVNNIIVKEIDLGVYIQPRT